MSIKVGSIVNVFYDNGNWSEREVEIISSPCAGGDCWTVKRKDGKEVKIQHYGKMEETEIKDISKEMEIPF